MKKAALSLATFLLLALYSLAGAAIGQEVYFLKDGSRAVIMERRLVLYRTGERRIVAPKGNYPTADGKYLIVVTGKDVTLVPAGARAPR